MQSLKARVLKVGIPLLTMAGAASATSDIETSMQPIIDLVGALVPIIEALIPVVIAVVVIVCVVAVGKMVTGLFSRIGGSIRF